MTAFPQPVLRPEKAMVPISGPINDETVNNCVASVDSLIEEYFYEQIELHIDSPGGSVASMLYLIKEADRWRQTVKLDTRALTCAASAAALILSLGNVRRASASSRLLYHNARFQPPPGSALTAALIRVEHGQLARLDALMLDHLVERACKIDRDSWLEHLESQQPHPDIDESGFCDHLFRPGGTVRQHDREAAIMDSRTGRGHHPPPHGEAIDRPGGETAGGLAERMAATLRSNDPESRLSAVYRNLLDLDVQISAGTAKTLGLVDAVGADDPRPLRLRETPTAAVPCEPGTGLLSVPEWRSLHPNGVSAKTLLRHTLILGETGSGKTASGILPIVRAAVGAMKDRRVGCLLVVDPKRDIAPVLRASGGVDVRQLSLTNDGIGEPFRLNLMAGTPVDLSAPDLRKAAEDILGKASSLCATNPMQSLVGSSKSAGRDTAFWDQQGVECGLIFLELALILLKHFDGTAPTEVSCRKEERERTVRRFLELRDDGVNVLVLAKHLLVEWGKPGDFTTLRYAVPELVGTSQTNPDGPVKHWLERAAALEQHADNDSRFFGSVVGVSLGCFLEFCGPDVAESLHFGCEPVTRHQCLDLAECVATDTDRPQVLLVQPDLSRMDSGLATKALKAEFFGAVLSDPIRQRPRKEAVPLVGYVADEFHRFATGDLRHGEQSFLDTCRSFGAFCVLATQSLSSLEHALGEIGTGKSTEPSIRVLVNNTGTKLQFRSTDPKTQGELSRILPHGQWGSPLAARPTSTLATGECYAVLADGRVARRQLGWVDADGLAESNGC